MNNKNFRISGVLETKKLFRTNFGVLHTSYKTKSLSNTHIMCGYKKHTQYNTRVHLDSDGPLITLWPECWQCSDGWRHQRHSLDNVWATEHTQEMTKKTLELSSTTAHTKQDVALLLPPVIRRTRQRGAPHLYRQSVHAVCRPSWGASETLNCITVLKACLASGASVSFLLLITQQ